MANSFLADIRAFMAGHPDFQKAVQALEDVALSLLEGAVQSAVGNATHSALIGAAAADVLSGGATIANEALAGQTVTGSSAVDTIASQVLDGVMKSIVPGSAPAPKPAPVPVVAVASDSPTFSNLKNRNLVLGMNRG